MGLLDGLRLASKVVEARAETPSIVTAQLAPYTFPEGPLYPYNLASGQVNVTRGDAMSVPAVARGRQLICNIGTFGLELYRENDGAELPKPSWMKQMDPRTPLPVTLSWLLDSLIFYGVGYLQVLSVFAEDGRPSSMAWIDPTTVSYDTNFDGTLITAYYVQGSKVPMSGVGSLVTFNGLDEGVLARAGRTIKAAVELEKAALVYAENPSPSGYLKNTGGEMDPEESTSLLNHWNSKRKVSATALLSQSLEYHAISFDPRALQLAEARQYIAVEIARLMNCPAWFLAADQGTGMTYASSLDERRALLDFTFRPYIAALESRLSMDDVTIKGQIVKVDMDTFLRGNALERIAVWEKMLTLGLMTVDEVRAEEDLAPRGNEQV